MGSRFPSKSVISENNSWDLENICRNSVNLDDMMLSIKQENIQCSVCNTKKETLAKREELAWQREDVIHAREKELREWELMLEEKNKLLIEKERQLNEPKKVLKIEAGYETNENSRKSSLTDSGGLEQHARSNSKIEFLLEKEKLLTETEKIISEKVKNIEKKEQSILLKEQLLSVQRINDNKERELAAQRNFDLELREQVVKKSEVALERKFKDIYEEKKSLDEREKLLVERESALSSAAEIVKNKEHILNERENMIIEKERNVIKQMCEISKLSETQCSDRKNDELLRKFDAIFEDKWKSVQQRETAVNHSELMLQERWKEYTKAQELLKSEEENQLSLKSTFEKEQIILREWEKLLQKQEDEFKKHKVIEEGSSEQIDRQFLSEEDKGTWQDIHRKEMRQQSSSFCAAVPSSNGESDLKHSDTSENIDLFNKAPCLEIREIAGDELLQFYEKEKKLLQAQLFEENAEISKNGQFSNAGKNVERHSELTETVQAFFKRISAGTNFNENKKEEVRCMPETNKKIDLSLSAAAGETKEEVALKENTPNNASVLDAKNNISIYSENNFTKERSSTYIESSIVSQMSDTGSVKKNNGISLLPSDLQMDSTTEMKDDCQGQTATNKIDVIQGSDSTSQIVAETAVSSKDGNEPQNLCNNAIREAEKKETEDESCLKNVNDPINKKSYEVSCTSPVSSASSTRSFVSCTSPVSSASSTGSLTSPTPLGKRQRRPDQTDPITEIMKEDCQQQTATNKIDVIQGNDSTSQIVAETAVSSKDGNEPQNLCNNAIREGEKKETEDESCLKNVNDPINKKNYKVSSTSPVSSASSTRSLTSPIPTGKRQKKPPKDALLQAISKQNVLETVQLLDTNCMSLEVRDDRGQSAVLLAVKYGNIDLVQRLIDKGAEIRACDYKGYSALHIAVVENNPEMVTFLLKRGLNPLVTNIYGCTALQLASNMKHSHLMDIINKFNSATST